MWAEARKQEKRIKGIMVDLKKRAERRKDFYEKIKADPVQFLQVHGRSAKINLDPFIAQAAEHPQNMMPLLGDTSNMIDRFDARSHLDFITEYKPSKNLENQTMDDILEERRCNYERYRLLVHLDSLEIKESQHLQQIKMEEQYPEIRLYEEEKKRVSDEKKKKKQKSAAISYTYEENESAEFQIFPPNTTQKNGSKFQKKINESEPSESEPEDDVHTSVVDAKFDLDLLSIHDIQRLGTKSSTYGILPIDFIQMVDKEKEDKAMLRLNKEMEEEKAMFAGKKARRERRLLREQRLRRTRRLSPQPYANRDSPSYDPYMTKPQPRSASKSPSPVSEEGEGAITYITSFGGEGGQNSDGGESASLTTLNDPKANTSLFKAKGLKMGEGRKDKEEIVGVEQGPTMPPYILKTMSGGRWTSPHYRGDRDGRRYPEGVGPRVIGVLREERHRDSRHRRSRERTRRSRSRDSRSRSRRRRRRSRSRRDDRRESRRHRSRRRSRDSRRRYAESPRRRKRTRSPSRKYDHKKKSPPSKAHEVFKVDKEKVIIPLLPKEPQPKPTPPVPIIPTTTTPLLAHPFQKIVYEGDQPHTRTPPPMLGWDVVIGGGDKCDLKQNRCEDNAKKRYRRASLSSSSQDSMLLASDSDAPTVPDSNDRDSRSSSSQRTAVSHQDGQNTRMFGKRDKNAPSKKLTPLERMKRQTALALNKIQKEDKKAMVERTEKQENERLEREEELRLLTLRITRRDRDRRHSDESNSSPCRSRSKSWDSHAKPFHRSRTKKTGSGHSSSDD